MLSIPASFWNPFRVLLCSLPLLSACVAVQYRVYSIEELAREASPSVAHIQTEHASGSGFLIAGTNLLVTNFHVLVGADAATVTLGDQRYRDLSVIASDREYDLAIIQLPGAPGEGLPLNIGIHEVHLGEQVITLGNPQGLRGSLSHGVVSTVARDMHGLSFKPIQITASISGGSSGGPLLNMRGQVIGVTSFTMKVGQNLNFAVPADQVREVLETRHAPLPLAQVFGSESPGYYRHQPGEFAAVLSWKGDVDLDLEIWNEDFEYLGDAFVLGNCWDITSGGTGEEYFVFKPSALKGLNKEGVDDAFASGRFIVSPYFVDGSRRRVDARLTIHYPDGSTFDLTRELKYDPPDDQWFALLVDTNTREVKTLDFFHDTPTLVLLEWDRETDLDLVVRNPATKQNFPGHRFPGSHDIQDGRRGLELFRFEHQGTLNFGSGNQDVLVAMSDPDPPETRAMITLLHQGQVVRRFTHTFTPDDMGSYFWHVMALNPETGTYTLPQTHRLPQSETNRD